MPGALVEFPRAVGPGNGDDAGDQIRWAGEHEGDGLRESEGLDSRREEVLEAVGGEMHVLHEGELQSQSVSDGERRTRKQTYEPQLRILCGFLEAVHGAGLGFGADCIGDDASVGELALFGVQPAGLEGVVGQDEDGGDRDDEGDSTLNDEEPV